MMKTSSGFYGRSLAILAAVIVLLPAAAPEEAKQISVGRMVFCRAIKDREPQEAAVSFPNDIEKVLCFTEILDAGAETHVVHKWYFGDELMAEVKLKAQGEYWRTWSSKRMSAEWTGTWRVDVVAADGTVLRSESFELVAPGQEPGPGEEQEPEETGTGGLKGSEGAGQ
jgi:hypothetical protein